jgi:hypothetical protein
MLLGLDGCRDVTVTLIKVTCSTSCMSMSGVASPVDSSNTVVHGWGERLLCKVRYV